MATLISVTPSKGGDPKTQEKQTLDKPEKKRQRSPSVGQSDASSQDDLLTRSIESFSTSHSSTLSNPRKKGSIMDALRFGKTTPGGESIEYLCSKDLGPARYLDNGMYAKVPRASLHRARDSEDLSEFKISDDLQSKSAFSSFNQYHEILHTDMHNANRSKKGSEKDFVTTKHICNCDMLDGRTHIHKFGPEVFI